MADSISIEPPRVEASPPGSREMILILEDDPGISRLESARLRRAGYDVQCAFDADQAREALRLGGVALIVLDQNLQGEVSGLDFYERIRAEGDETPAILVTGFGDERTLLRAIRGGLSDFVPKTVDYMDDLAQAVDRVLTRSRTRRLLAESEARLAGVTLLAEAIPQIVWAARPDGFIEYFNGRWAEYSGLTPDESLGWNWHRAIHPDDLEPAGRAWARSLATGEVFEAEFRLRRRSGAFRWFLVRAELVRDRWGQVHRWFGTMTDIDDRKRAEQDLKRAREMAETASLAKDKFLAMLSHELRTPLTPVLMAASAARDDPDTPGHLRETFDLIRQNLELEARLIDDLLDVMKIVRGKLPYQFEPVDAHAQVLRAVEICRSEAEAKGLVLSVDLRAVERRVHADASRLQQVLWNLIKNAIKFTPDGGSIAIRTRPAGPGRLVVEVADTGIGIDPGHLPHIFNAFEQGEDAITRRFGGLGLGLAISRSIVEGHGGTLTATSEGRGHGSTFVVELPVEPGTPEGPAEPSTQADRPEDSPTEPEPTARILLVEDDPMTARIMAKLLRQNGFVVTTAGSVADALGVPDDSYDLVVSDVGLPDGTGLDLIRAVRGRRHVPAIALTGFGMDDDIRRSREAGFDAHLTKPVDFARLDEAIRQVVAGRAPLNAPQ